jgi:vacuolar-type H+-ATPase subunit H
MKEQNQPEYTGLFDAGIVVLKECEAKLKELAKALPYKVQPHFLETYNRLFVAGVQGIYTNRVLLRDLPAHRANERVFAEHHTANILLESKILVDFDVVANELAQTELDLANHTQELAGIQDALLGKAGARSKVVPKDAEEKNARGINLKELLKKATEKITKLREWISQNASKIIKAIEDAQAAGEKVWEFIQSKFQDARITMQWVKKISEGKFDLKPVLAVAVEETQNNTAEELPTQTAE